MIIVGIDTETTGLTDDKEIVEIGYAIIETDSGVLISSGSELFAVEKWSSEAEKIHHIPEWATKIASLNPSQIDLASRILPYKPTLIVAHYAISDYSLVCKHWPKLDKSNIKWLCSKEDLPHEKIIPGVTSTRLMHLAVDYGITVHGWHRAMQDAETAARIAAKHDLKKIVAWLDLPKFKVTLRGRFSEDGGKLAKKLNFRWNPDDKVWLRENLAQADANIIEQAFKKTAPGWSVELIPTGPRAF